MEVKEAKGQEFECGSLEAAAMRRIDDIFKPNTFWHGTTWDKIDLILKDGLINQVLAQRAKKNEYHSVYAQAGITDPRQIFFWRTGLKNTPKLMLSGSVGLFVRSERIKQSYQGHDLQYESKTRIRPKEFVGLLLGTKIRIGGNLEEDALIDLRVWHLVRNLLACYEDSSELILPIYDFDGNLLWPKRITHGEILRMLAEKHEKRLV